MVDDYDLAVAVLDDPPKRKKRPLWRRILQSRALTRLYIREHPRPEPEPIDVLEPPRAMRARPEHMPPRGRNMTSEERLQALTDGQLRDELSAAQRELAQAQRQIDDRHGDMLFANTDAQLLAKRKVRLDAAQAEEQRRGELAQAEREAELRADLQRKWIAAGGSAAEFSREYLQLRAKALAERTIHGDAQAEAEAARRAAAWRARL